MPDEERRRVSQEDEQEIRVLHVDEDEAFGALVQDCFEASDYAITVTTEVDPTRALGTLEHGTAVDAVICDYRMDGMDGVELLREIRRHDRSVPVVMLTGSGSESVASDSFRAGATDYFVKGEAGGRLELLVERVRSAVLDRRGRIESERFDTLIEMLEAPVLAVDTDGTVVSTNGRFQESFRRGDDGTLQLTDLVVADERETVRGYLETLRRDTGPDVVAVELTFQSADGATETHRTRLAAVPDVGGVVENVLVVVEPSSQGSRFEVTLADLVEWATGPYITVDASWEITLANDAAATLFGRSKESLVGDELWDVFPAFEDATFHDQLQAVADTGSPLETEVFYAPDQTHFHVRAYQTNKGVGVYLHDITSRVAHAQKLEKQSNRLRDFVGTVSHDLRNPLTVAKGQVDILKLTGTSDAETLETLRNSLVRAEQIIDQALAFAEEGRIDEPVPVTLGEIAARSWETVATDGATCDIESTATVFADPDALGRVFENLFRNSVEHGSTGNRPEAGDSVEHGSTGSRATPDDSVEHGGRSVAVRLGDLPSTETTVGFYVEDDGPGISEERQSEVFQTDFSTNRDGVGFGLAIVDQVSAAHGWNLEITESPSGGARFEFTGITPFIGAGASMRDEIGS